MKKILFILVLGLCSLFSLAQPIYENHPTTGEIEVTLHPGTSVILGNTELVSFGVPFPRSLVNNTSQIIVTNASDVELPSSILETLRWYSLSDDTSVDGLRSVLIHVNITFTTLSPITLKVKYGQTGNLPPLQAPQGDIKDRWVTFDDPDDPYDDNIGVREPTVFVTLTPEWMSKCVIRTKFTPIDQVLPEYEWHSDASLIIGNTFSTQFSDPYNSDNYELWLFDRASSFWNLYMRTGELKWLRTAHKTSQFYASGINEKGEFAFNPNYPKLMYCYGMPLIIDIMMTGDVELEDQILDIAEFGVERNFELTDTRTSLWTERGLAYWILSALTAFEATGEQVYKDRVISRFEGAYNRNPDGVMLHQLGLHEIGGLSNDDRLSQPIISPWMNALLSEAIWRYYLHSEDIRALQFIAGMGEHIARHCIYEVTPGFGGINPSSSLIGSIQPAYLWSGETSQEYLQTDPFTTVYDDDQHALDVVGLLARANWAQKKLGNDTSITTTGINQLITTSKAELERRNYSLSSGAGRKYNWQYGTTSDIDWLITNNPDSILGVNDLLGDNEQNTRIYPNPTRNIINITTTSGNAETDFYSITGKLLFTTNKNQVSISAFSPGMYILKIVDGNSFNTSLMIKK